MKTLFASCAVTALMLGLSIPAQAEIVVRDAPIHAVPQDADDQPAPTAEAAAHAEPAPVKALIQPNAPPAPTLTADETAFFAVLGRRVTDAASAYESYVRRVGAIDPAFTGAASVQRAVASGAAYQPKQLEEGVIAYAALIALRNENFVAGVRALQNPAFIDSLATAPDRVMQVRGAAEAAADAAGVLKAQGAALTAAGKAITKAAYDIQGQAWSKAAVQDPQGVLDAAKASGGQARAATVPSKAKLLASLVVAPQTQGSAEAAPDVVRGLALAALAILGRTGDGNEAQYEALLRDASSEDCLKLAKLNLNQCLAVAGPHYEDVYCAGRHAVSDTGKCVSQAATGASSPDAMPAPRIEQAVGPEEAEAYAVAMTAPPAAGPQPARQPQPSPYSYAQNDYAPPQPAPPAYPQQAYAPPAPQGYYPAQTYPGYGQPQYPTQPASQPLYQSAPYPQQAYNQGYAPQPYYQQGYAPQAPQGYYGR